MEPGYTSPFRRPPSAPFTHRPPLPHRASRTASRWGAISAGGLVRRRIPTGGGRTDRHCNNRPRPLSSADGAAPLRFGPHASVADAASGAPRPTGFVNTGKRGKGHGRMAGLTGTAPERLLYIDNLRLMVITFVVMQHLAVTYSGFGSWYYVEGIPLDTLSTIWFAFYESFQQAYFLGLLFLITGYFAAGSYDRRGFGPFVRGRFRRLVVPTLIYMVAITPFIEFVELGRTGTDSAGSTGFTIIDFLSGTGVMWFAAALFLFSLLYALVRVIVPRSPPSPGERQLEPSPARAVVLIVVIAVSAFLIRIVQPIGTSVLNMQLCYFASYIALFFVGIVAYRNDLFARIGYRTGKRWLIGGIALGFLAWLALVIVATATGTTAALNGGLTWQSAAFSLWESYVAVAMSIGLIAVFRERFNRQSPLVRTLSENSFAVYMFHPPIIIAVTLLLSAVALYPVVKWAVLCLICLPLCFAATHYVFRRIPLLKNVL